LRVPAREVEGLVLDQIRQIIESPQQVATAMVPLDLSANELGTLLIGARDLANRWLTISADSQRELVRKIISRVTLSVGQIEINVDLSSLATALGTPTTREILNPPALVRQIPAKLRRSGKGNRMIIGDAHANKIDPGLVRLINEAMAIRCVVLTDSSETLNEITAHRRKSKGYLTSLMRLSYLAPQIIDDILNGRQPPEMSALRLLRFSSTLPLEWGAQRAHLQFA
jgi:site-specific DNA recombinase